MRPTLAPGIAVAFAEVVGGDQIVVDPDVLAGNERDWTGRFIGATPALIRPGSTAEVAEIVAICRREGVSLVPQGGNTGLVGGSVPLCGEVIVHLGRLDAISDLDTDQGQLTAGAGVSVASVQAAARRVGWTYAVDLASRDSATVGGTIATNAGGLKVLRYGHTRHQILGVSAALGNGSTISRLGGLVKDNTGYDLAGLLCGSEGTLGVVTAARLRLTPHQPEHAVALVGYADVRVAVEVGQSLRRLLPSVEAVELFEGAGMDLVCSTFGLAPPFAGKHRAYLLAEAADSRDPSADLVRALEASGPVAASALAKEPARRTALWRYREAHTEAIGLLGTPHKFDVTLPGPELADFILRIPRVVYAVAPNATTCCFGHVADGNIHVNVTGIDAADGAVDEAVLGDVIDAGGSISAEHGIGTAKKPWLARYRSSDEMAAFRHIKRALDPDGVCNPNVLL